MGARKNIWKLSILLWNLEKIFGSLQYYYESQKKYVQAFNIIMETRKNMWKTSILLWSPEKICGSLQYYYGSHQYYYGSQKKYLEAFNIIMSAQNIFVIAVIRWQGYLLIIALMGRCVVG